MQTFLTYAAQVLEGLYQPQEIRQLAYTLLVDCCGFSKNEIYACKDTKISGMQRLELYEKLERLVHGEPLQYVTGLAYFYDLKLKVSPAVLIPRPETEELVEWIIKENKNKGGKVLDVGTGSGCIALALACHLPEMRIEAWDISPAALELARQNASGLKLEVVFKEQDLFLYQNKARHGQLDLIVSNPPYVTAKEASQMDNRVLHYEPSLALFVSDDDPLSYYRALALLSAGMLRPGGALYVEISSFYGPETVSLFKDAGFEDVVLRQDISGRDRMIRVRKSLHNG